MVVEVLAEWMGRRERKGCIWAGDVVLPLRYTARIEVLAVTRIARRSRSRLVWSGKVTSECHAVVYKSLGRGGRVLVGVEQ